MWGGVRGSWLLGGGHGCQAPRPRPVVYLGLSLLIILRTQRAQQLGPRSPGVAIYRAETSITHEPRHFVSLKLCSRTELQIFTHHPFYPHSHILISGSSPLVNYDVLLTHPLGPSACPSPLPSSSLLSALSSSSSHFFFLCVSFSLFFLSNFLACFGVHGTAATGTRKCCSTSSAKGLQVLCGSREWVLGWELGGL